MTEMIKESSGDGRWVYHVGRCRGNGARNSRLVGKIVLVAFVLVKQ